MSARPDTWMPVYWGDYARDTGHLNAAGHGAYLMLIKHYWCTGTPLIDDDSELWRIACCDSEKEWMKLRQKVVRLFIKEGGILRHKRIDREIKSASEAVSAKAEAGKRGAEKRWQKDGSAIAVPLAKDASAIGRDVVVPKQTHDFANAPSPSPSPSPSEKEERVIVDIGGEPDTSGLQPSVGNENRPDDTMAYNDLNKAVLGRMLVPVDEPAAKAKPSPLGTRLPEDWNPGHEGAAFAKGLGIDPKVTWDKFRDYWRAKPGAAGRKIDWQATWRNWCRTEAGGRQGAPRQTAAGVSSGWDFGVMGEAL